LSKSLKQSKQGVYALLNIWQSILLNEGRKRPGVLWLPKFRNPALKHRAMDSSSKHTNIVA
jgi:hypothetical protein